MKKHVSWTGKVNGVSAGGSHQVQDWEDVWQYLVNLRENAGTVRIHLVDAPDSGPISIQLRSENKIYLVTLLEANEEGTDVREYNNPTAHAEMIDILGDCWDARQLTNDFDLVVILLKQFFETGDVSHQWLN